MRVSTTLIGGCAALLVLSVASMAGAEAAEGTPTFAKDVAPILYENCVACHRPNHLAPMSLITYNDARPWARAVKAKVLAREMPPWGADSSVRAYKNDASLTQGEIDTIAAWVDAGAPEGNGADLPEVPQFAEGWSIGEPDLIFSMVKPFDVPADGTVPYTYVTVPTNLSEDTWISAHEFRPGDRRVIHHVIPSVLEDDGEPVTGEVSLRRSGRTRASGASVGGYVPNRLGTVYEDGVAVLLPKGADIEAQMHYTTIGEPVSDVSSWGVVVAKTSGSKPRRRAGGGQVASMSFAIEPGNPDYAVISSREIQEDTYLSTMMPHMHVRGKSAKYTVIRPDGSEEVALWVPNYDFNWQLSYVLAEPIFMPKGSKLQAEFHYDNSGNNRFNPDPTAEVHWGDQTWEEMMLGYYGTVNAPEGSTPTSNQQ